MQYMYLTKTISDVPMSFSGNLKLLNMFGNVGQRGTVRSEEEVGPAACGKRGS